LRFPSDEDLNGAAVALMRLQDTYKLDTHALAKGELLGKKYSRQLTGNQKF
jgi:prolyl 4-hydroxylase